MNRIVTASLVGALLATTAVAAPASAGTREIVRTQYYRSGGNALFWEIQGDVRIMTEVSFSLEATQPNGDRAPFMWINQSAALAVAEGDEEGAILWAISGSTTAFDLSIAADLTSANVQAPEVPVERCDGDWNCTEDTVSVAIDLTAFGPMLRFHQNSISSVSGQSRFVAHGFADYRFANATVTVDGVAYGPSTGPVDASIYDSRDSYMDVTLVPFGMTAPAVGISPYDTSAPGVGVQAGQGVLASWTREQEGVFVSTFLSGNTRHLVGNGTVADESQLFYYEQVYLVDDQENLVTLSETYTVEGATADLVAVDNNLRTGVLRVANAPAVTCTYIDGEPVCNDTTISASASFTGYGTTVKATDGEHYGIAGAWQVSYRRTSTSRNATAIATIDGVAPGTQEEGRIDIFKQGYRELTIK